MIKLFGFLLTLGVEYGLLTIVFEVWLSLVERYVREQIADYERKIYKTAETP